MVSFAQRLCDYWTDTGYEQRESMNSAKTKAGWTCVLPAMFLIVIAVWETIFTLVGGRGVSAEDWQPVSRLVRKQSQLGDRILFHPQWLAPVGRQYLGDRMPLEVISRMDNARFRTIWVVAIAGTRHPDTEALRVAGQWDMGALSVARYDQTPIRLVTDFVEEFADGAAVVKGDFARAPSVELEEVGFALRKCIRAIPNANGSVSIQFNDVALGKELVGYVGLADVFTRRDVREPGQLLVSVKGEESPGQVRIVAGNDDGWMRFSLTTAPASHSTVVFTAESPGVDARDRRICFAAEARR